MDKLNEMTLNELWELFPIVLTSHNPQWKDWADDEISSLSELLAGYSPIINHIGSTAISDIQAKPIIDILIEIPTETNRQHIKAAMENVGYICMSSSGDRMSFNKGYTPEGFAEKVFHIHVHTTGDNNEILFRDYLRNNPAIAHEYELLKMSLLPKYKNDRDGYTEAKTEFIKRITNIVSGKNKHENII